MKFLVFQFGFFEPVVVLWYIAVSLLFIIAAIFIIQAQKMELKSQKNVYRGYGLFSFFFGLTRFFFLLAFFEENMEIDYFYLMIGYLMGTLGVIVIIFILETYLLKTKKILTLISVILFVIILISIMALAREFALIMIYILLPSSLIAGLSSYVYLIFKSTGSSRKKALGALLGLILILIGHFVNTTIFTTFVPNFPQLLSPIILSIGILVFGTSQLLIK